MHLYVSFITNKTTKDLVLVHIFLKRDANSVWSNIVRKSGASVEFIRVYWRGAICIFPFLLFSSNHYKNRHSAFQNSWGNKLTISDDVWVLLGMYMLRKTILIWKWLTRWNAYARIQNVCELDWKFPVQSFCVQIICR